MKLITYLSFEGNAIEAMTFYKDILGGEFTNLQKYKEMPGFAEMEEFQNFGEYYLHGRLETPDFHIYFSDSHMPVTFGDSVSISLQFDDVDEINRIYEAFIVDAKEITMPIGDTFWGARYASFTDKFGIMWQLNCQIDGQ